MLHKNILGYDDVILVSSGQLYWCNICFIRWNNLRSILSDIIDVTLVLEGERIWEAL